MKLTIIAVDVQEKDTQNINNNIVVLKYLLNIQMTNVVINIIKDVIIKKITFISIRL